MATKTEGRIQNAAELLRQDHQELKALFRDYAALGDRALTSKQRLADEIFRKLEIHSKLEEEIFYPRAEQARESLEEIVAEGLEEHHVADVLIAELRGLDPSHEKFAAKMKVLQENIEHHIEEEEEELLPQAERSLGAEIDAVGGQMLALKAKLTAA